MATIINSREDDVGWRHRGENVAPFLPLGMLASVYNFSQRAITVL
jgi:hypothetical protein